MQILLGEQDDFNEVFDALLGDELVLEGIRVRQVGKQDGNLLLNDWVFVTNESKHAHNSLDFSLLQQKLPRHNFHIFGFVTRGDQLQIGLGLGLAGF